MKRKKKEAGGKLGEISILWSIAGIALPAAAILGTLCYLLARQDRNEKKQCSVFRKGQTTVKVWYNPENPDEAVIEGANKFQWGAMGSIVFMTVYVFGAIFIAAMGYWWPVIISFPIVFIGFWIFLLKLMNPK